MNRALSAIEQEALADCDGYAVEASDGQVGEVETPIFPPDRSEPDFLVLRVGRFPRVRRPVVATVLVQRVDLRRGRIRVRGTREQIASLPVHLPLAV
jgi:hypothetical protein